MKIATYILVLLLTVISSRAGEPIEPIKLRIAVQHLEHGEPARALSELEAYLEMTESGPYIITAELLAARCELALKRTDKTIVRVNRVLEMNPDHAIAAQCHYLFAAVFQARGDSYAAALELVDCLNLNPEGNTLNLAKEKLKELADGPALYCLETLQDLARSENCKSALSDASLNKVDLFASTEAYATIGVIFQLSPTTGEAPDSTKGLNLIDGVRAAAEKHGRELSGSQSQEPEQTIQIVSRIIPSNTVVGVLAAREMIRRDGILGLIIYGPESEAMAITVEAQAHGIPTILPGQRRPGLYAIGPTTVQPEADWYREGELAAIYAVDSLHLRTFAVIAPVTPMGQENASGFTSILENRQMTELLALEWYFPEQDISLNRQFLRIREIGFKREFADSLFSSKLTDSLFHLNLSDRIFAAGFIDSLLRSRWEIHKDLIDRYWREHLQDIRLTPLFKSGALDSNDIELKAIDGIYLPIEPGGIELFAPQFAFYNFKTQCFGNSAWNEPDELYRHRQYTNDLIFTSSYNVSNLEENYPELSLYIYKQHGMAPGLWQVRGYDSASILLSPLLDGPPNVGTVADAVRSLQKVSLGGGIQHFAPDRRVALDMWLFTVVEGEIHLEDSRQRLQKLSPMLDESK